MIRLPDLPNDKYEIAIAYRIYPKVSKIPPIFRDDKLKLSELCLKSFKASLGSLKIKMWVMLDNCPPEYTGIFRKYFPDANLEFVPLPGIGNGKTFKLQMEILSQQNDSEIIYFAEDDYSYLPGTFPEMLEYLNCGDDIHFLTPYDHPDYYNIKFQNHKRITKNFHGRTWKSALSTTMTFLTKKSTLQQAYHTFLTYSHGNFDASLWMTLTRLNLLKPWSFFGYDAAKIYIKSWLHSPVQNIFGRKYNLWYPTPAIATHLDSEYMSGACDWEEIFKLYS